MNNSIVETLETPISRRSGESVREELREALRDKEIVALFSQAMATQISDILQKELTELREELSRKDREIESLNDRIDELEQYGRRNSVRINGVPEAEGEVPDDIVKKVAREMGVELSETAIDRSHRVGRRSEKGDGRQTCRPIIVKLQSYRHKQQIMAAKKRLANVDARRLFPAEGGPPPPLPSYAAAAAARPAARLYINEDLTRTRAELAARAREEKRKRTIGDTWTRDGVIFIKRGSSVHKVTTRHQLEALLRGSGPLESPQRAR